LIVDDEIDILNLLEYNLTKAGFRVISAKDGPEAIELAKARGPDLIILDIMLPNMEGTDNRNTAVTQRGYTLPGRWEYKGELTHDGNTGDLQSLLN
jgi:two-component system alkaline phosphatase synthesis response regulator PhoP